MVQNVFIMRGVSGSGKSTYAKATWPKGAILSSDDFWEFLDMSKTYQQNFDPSRLGEAHAWNLKRFIDYLGCADAPFWAEPLHTIVIDNTNTSVTEIAPYYAVAQAFKVPNIELITIATDPAVAFNRNTHGVPPKAHDAQVERLYANNCLIPPWWNHRIVRPEEK